MGKCKCEVEFENTCTVEYINLFSGRHVRSFLSRFDVQIRTTTTNYYAEVEGIPLYDNDPKHVRIQIPTAYFGLIRTYTTQKK